MSKNNLIVGLPKEIIPGECRVICLPNMVKEIVDLGFTVYVETGFANGIGINDSAYLDSGANILEREYVWRHSDIIIKYKAPLKSEFEFFRPGMIIAAIMHGEGNIDLINAFVNKKVTAFSFEFFRDKSGVFPLAKSGGIIAGRMSALYAIFLLQRQFGGCGKLPGIVLGNNNTVTCTVIGAGNVGIAATSLLCDLGCHVNLLTSSDISAVKTRSTLSKYTENLNVVVNSNDALDIYLPKSDIVIGAILISTFDTPPMLPEEKVKKMRKGAVLLDATAGYGGGYMPTFEKNTSLDMPSYIKHGVVHCKIDNFPAAVPISSVELTNNIYKPYLLSWLSGIKKRDIDAVSINGLITHDGVVMHEVVSKHMMYWESMA